ncbi:transcription factor IIIB 50 kDa subunit [Gadus morhua]|uniref:transcription factor IIIB 50 kDa subunit n=1 Tax=Gadus morhua TaxID=8049 RepID=UPI0011B569E1|nr:transcription factor IIIB 50 kDa subunit [Gadus morhua]
MLRAARSCPQCGSSSVVQDDLYAESQLVCQDCGSVVSEGLLVTDTGAGTEDVRYSHSTAQSKVPCRNLIKGLQRVRALCRILRLSYDVEELAEVYFRQAYTHASFIHVTLAKKEALVGCCVLVSCRLRNWPLALGTISGLVETDPALVGGVFKQLEKVLDVEVPKSSITYVLEAHSREYKLSSAHVPEELAETSADLAKRAVALVELATDSWIVTGRHPVPIMMAAIFLSWQSLRPTKTRLRYSLNKFCRLSHMPLNKTAAQRVGEMREVLCRLGQEIPWLSGGAPDDVALHVEDILQHRHALLREALRTHEVSQRAEEEESQGAEEEEGGSRGTEGESRGTEGESRGTEGESRGTEGESRGTEGESLGAQEDRRGTQEEIQGNGIQPSTVDPPPRAPGHQPDGTDSPPEPCTLKAVNGDPEEGGGETQGTQEQRPAVHWGKRAMFAPPCARHAKVCRTDASRWAEVNGDEEISDSEIDSYIRRPQEVRDYLQTQQQLLAATEDQECSGKK